MRVIVIDNNTQEVIIYSISKKDEEWMSFKKDLSEIIEEMLCNQEHKLSEVSWMILSDEFQIKFKEM